MIPLLGFLPDAPTGTPGAIVDCINFVPSATGMAAGAARALTNTPPPFIGAVSSAFVGKNTFGVSRLIAASASGLLSESTTSGWFTSVAGSAGETYSFASFGNVILASSTAAAIRTSTHAAAVPPSAGVPFLAVANAPAANILVAAKNFVLAFDTDDAIFGVSRDRWWCSAFQDALSWTINPITQANTGRLVGIPGQIRAAAMLGDVCVAYKETGAYIGREAGPPYSWQWDDVDSGVGCVGKLAVCNVGESHFVVGPDDIWLFDGSRSVSVAEGKIKRWLFTGDGVVGPQIDVNYAHKTTCVYEEDNTRVWVFYVRSGSLTGGLDAAVVYNVRTARWGVADREVQCAFALNNASGSHIGSLQPFSNFVAFFASDDSWMYTIGAVGVDAYDASQFDVDVTGDDFAATYVRSVVLRYNRQGATATIQGFTRDEMTGPSTLRQVRGQAGGRFNITQDGRWHWFRFLMTGNYEVAGYTIDGRRAGRK